MKKSGSVSDFGAQRNAELIKAFRRVLSSPEILPQTEVYRRVISSPAPRFWVSDQRAAIILGRMLKGDRLTNMHPKKREMFKEIFRRFMEYRRRQPGCSITEAAFSVVNSPAPEFYLTPDSVRVILSRIRTGYYSYGATFNGMRG